MSIQQNQIVQPTYNGQDIYYRTPVDAIITDGMSLDDYIRNTTGVVESGENSNGSYIKFADGTLIQQGNTGIFSVPAGQAGTKAVTFPINFYDTDYYVTQTEIGGGGYWSWVNVSTQNKTVSGFNCSCWSNTNASAASVGYSWIAIGRWKDYDVSVLPSDDTKAIVNTPITNYSNDEQVIGLWTDGKPLYRKTYNFGSLPNASSKSISSGLSGVNIKNTYGACHRPTDTFQPPVNSVRPNGAGSEIGAYYDGSNNITFNSGSTDRTGMTAEITFEYTKDSDQPVTSQTKDLLTIVNGKNINDLETIIQQRVNQVVDATLLGRYNLVTDGPEVKTGRTIDGKDEYTKRYSFTNINAAGTYAKSLGLTLNSINITDIHGEAFSNSSNWFSIPMGDVNNVTTWTMRFELTNSSNSVTLITINGNFSKAFITICYTYK